LEDYLQIVEVAGTNGFSNSDVCFDYQVNLFYDVLLV